MYTRVLVTEDVRRDTVLLYGPSPTRKPMTLIEKFGNGTVFVHARDVFRLVYIRCRPGVDFRRRILSRFAFAFVIYTIVCVCVYK